MRPRLGAVYTLTEEVTDEMQIEVDMQKKATSGTCFDGFTPDGEATGSYVDFNSMAYGLMDVYAVRGGNYVTDHVGAGAVPFTEAVCLRPAASYIAADAHDLRITLRYFDGACGGLTVRYAGAEGEKTALTVSFRGTEAWMLATVRVRDAAFDPALNHAVCVEATGGATVYLSRVEVQVVDATQLAETEPPVFAPQTKSNNIIGAAIAGYQMWFHASDKDEEWVHWGQGDHPNPAPGNGNVHVEIYPYVKDYIENGATLHESCLGELGNGDKSMLFTSRTKEVVDTHFQWIRQYGIDCLAVQRFACGEQRELSEAENHLCLVRDAAEKYDKTFYVMYDFTHDGWRDYDGLFEAVTTDMVYNVERVSGSPAYAHADGKPVVCLWGISGDSTSYYPSGYRVQRIMAWLKERGYYVIVGTPDYMERDVDGKRMFVEYTQRTGEWLAPFVMADMLSPWTVGRYNYSNCEEWIPKNVPSELEFCKKYGIEYLPVIYPGFSWSNMQDNGQPNHYPRYAGDFVWRQATSFAKLGIGNVYYAMFDEYDEATAYMKGPADYFEIPKSQYFVTYAVDGYWLSNDYYLRVAGKAAQLFKGENKSDKLGIPYSQGPIYWRNSFERRWTTYVEGLGEKCFTILRNVDVCAPASVTLGLTDGTVKFMDDQEEIWFLTKEHTVDTDKYATAQEGTGIFRDVSGKYTKSGEWAFRLDANVTANATKFSHVLADADKTDIMISAAGLELKYSLYAETAQAEHAFVELILEDGTQLSVVDPAFGAARGKMGQWVDVTLRLPASLVGQHIRRIAIGYQGDAGEVKAIVDDIILQSPDTAADMLRTAVDTAGRLPQSVALTEMIANAKTVCNDTAATDAQRLAAVRAIDAVIRTTGCTMA